MRLIFSAIIFSLSCTLWAATAAPPPMPMKTVELGWEKVPGAGRYEVKLEPAGGGKPLIFKTSENHLARTIPAGTYQLQVRSLTPDGEQASPWSKPIPFEAVTKVPEPLYPADNATVVSKKTTKEPLEFRWSPVDQVRSYTLKIWTDSKDKTLYSFTTRATHKKLGLVPGRVYHWQVLFQSANHITYQQNPKTFSFTLKGTRLLKPDLSPLTKVTDVESLLWRPSPGAQRYSAQLSYRYLDEKKWTVVMKDNLAAPNWSFKKLKPGAYKLEVTATAPHRFHSETAVKEFTVKPSQAELTAALSAAD